MSKLAYWARKIHRWSLWFVVFFGLIQIATGLAMKYPSWFLFVDQAPTRLLHFQTAGYFSLTFGIQMLTGIIMYLAPWLLKKYGTALPPTKLPH